MKNPLVTVIIPAFNHELYVQQTINSVIKQDYSNIELIIINDGSYDNTHNKIMELYNECKKRFTYFEYENRIKNQGLAKTLNYALRKAKGEYISFLASDDIYLPNKISLLIKELSKYDKTYAVVCGNAFFMDKNGKRVSIDSKGNILPYKIKKSNQGIFYNFIDFYTKNRDDIDLNKNFGEYKTFLRGNYIPAMSTLIRKEAIFRVGLFEESYYMEDYDLWLKISKKYKFIYINRIVAGYRLHDKNTIKIYKKQLAIDRLKLLCRELAYCQEKELYNLWHESFANTLLSRILFSRYFYSELRNLYPCLRRLNVKGIMSTLLHKFTVKLIKKEKV